MIAATLPVGSTRRSDDVMREDKKQCLLVEFSGT